MLSLWMKLRMILNFINENASHVNAGSLIFESGSDPGRRGSARVRLPRPAGAAGLRFRVGNTLEEYQRLAEHPHRLGAPALIGFEATGNYHQTLARFLHHQGFRLPLIPTLALARTSEAMQYNV